MIFNMKRREVIAIRFVQERQRCVGCLLIAVSTIYWMKSPSNRRWPKSSISDSWTPQLRSKRPFGDASSLNYVVRPPRPVARCPISSFPLKLRQLLRLRSYFDRRSVVGSYHLCVIAPTTGYILDNFGQWNLEPSNCVVHIPYTV